MEDALVREIKEEFGLDVRYRCPLLTFSYTLSSCHTVGGGCWASLVNDGQPLSFDRADNEEVVWVTQVEAIKYIDMPRNHNYEAVLEGFRVTDDADPLTR